MKVSNVSIQLEIVVEHPKTHFTTSKMFCADSLVEDGRYERAVGQAARKLLKMIQEEGLEPQTLSEQIPRAMAAGDECREIAAFPENANLSPTALLLPSSSV